MKTLALAVTSLFILLAPVSRVQAQSNYDVSIAFFYDALPPVPADLGITMGDHSGEIDLHWTPSKGAKSYIIECAPYNTPRVWQQVKITTRSSFTVTGLTPGTTYVFRVKAIGSGGDSDWSDEAVKMAP